MSYIMTSTEFVNKLYALANHKTVYGWGTWGHECTADYIKEKKKQYPTHYTDAKAAPMLELAKSGDGWMFDCAGMIKAILWGWNGDKSDPLQRGGAKYQDGFPDTNASGIMTRCNNVTTDFSDIGVGEMVYKTGHIGVYVGNGRVIECTPSWDSGVQITELGNVNWGLHDTKSTTWLKHGKLRELDYRVKTGSLVDFVGDTTGTSQYGDVTRKMKKGLVKVTQSFSGGGARPIHIVFDRRGTSNASGFVTARDLR